MRRNKTRNIKCTMCENVFQTKSNKAKYCESCRTYAEFRKNMETPEWRLKKLVAGAKNRSKTKSLDFNLDIDYVLSLWEENLKCCALTGVPFDLTSWGEKGQVNPNAPSIDRIEPKLGYIKGNVRLITYHMNISLSDFGVEIFEGLVRSYLENNR